MVGQASSPSINGTGKMPILPRLTGNPAFSAGRRHQILLLFTITFENPYRLYDEIIISNLVSFFGPEQQE